MRERLANIRPVRAFRLGLQLLALIFLFSPVLVYAEGTAISGFTEPYLESRLGIAVSGNVTRIHLSEGAAVEKGQVILELDQQLEELEVQRRKQILESKAEIQSAALQAQTIKPQLNATRELFKTTGSVRREDLENQELEYALAVDELSRLEDAEKREEIEYSIARQRLYERSLRAPFAGRIAEMLTNVGENCELDIPLVYLVNTSRGYFVANVDLGLSRQLSMGQTVELQLQAGPESISRTGEIIFISPVVDPASGLRKVKVLFDNQDGKIIIGAAGVMVVNVEN